jgi:hypothetical protein
MDVSPLENRHSAAGWRALEEIQSAVARYQRVRATPEATIVMNAIFDAQRRQDDIVAVDETWVTDLKDGREVAVWPEIQLTLNKANCSRLEAWLESRGAGTKFNHLSDEDWRILETQPDPDQLPEHLFKLVDALVSEIWRALDDGDPAPDELIEPRVSKIEIRRVRSARGAEVSQRSTLDDLRSATDGYQRAEAALAAHPNDETLRRKWRMARDCFISAANSSEPTEEDPEHAMVLFDLADGRQAGLQAVIAKKPEKKYRVEAKNWLRSHGITQRDSLGRALVNAWCSEDPTVPRHFFGVVKWKVHIRRKP